MGRKLVWVLLVALWFVSAEALCQTPLADPGFKDQTKMVYAIDLKGKFSFDYLINVKASKQKYEVLSWSQTGTSEGQKEHTIYSRKPFRPLYYNTSVDIPEIKYSKSIWWNWGKSICDFYEISQEPGKKDQGEKFSAKMDDEKTFYNFVLINTGLLCGLPLSNEQDRCGLRIFFGQNSVKVNFKIASVENLLVGGRSYECYKVEANPEMGAFLDLLRFFLGNPKSYVWLTRDYPRLIVKAHVKMPWMEYKADLKEIETTAGL